ncbi:MAG: right-handed parallel beta-helix repeat-containing protein [Nitrosotalea sp.]
MSSYKILMGFGLLVLFSILIGTNSAEPAYALKTINNNSTGGDCQLASIGIWNNVTSTCKLTNDLTEGVVIGSNNITLDGNGHTISGTSGNGILLEVRTGVTVKNVNVKNFDTGINADNSIGVTLSGDTITSSTTFGISVSYSNQIKVTGNAVSNSGHGIYFVHSTQNTISNNSVSNNNDAITLSLTDNSSVSGNTVSNNSGNGILLIYYGTDTVTGNTVTGNNGGISLSQSQSDTVSGNTVTGNQNGILVNDGSYNAILTKNTISSNTNNGIIISGNGGTRVYDNTISKNNLGISMNQNNGGTFYNNNLLNNQIQVTGASGSSFSLNPPIGGNYWSDYSPQCSNANGGNFCDSPYPFSGGTVGVADNYPWVVQNGWHTTITTGGNITKTSSSPLTVSYNVSAQNDNNTISVNCTPSSGSSFPVGITIVTCTASTGVKTSFAVTVQLPDTIPPVVTPPSKSGGYCNKFQWNFSELSFRYCS